MRPLQFVRIVSNSKSCFHASTFFNEFDNKLFDHFFWSHQGFLPIYLFQFCSRRLPSGADWAVLAQGDAQVEQAFMKYGSRKPQVFLLWNSSRIFKNWSRKNLCGKVLTIMYDIFTSQSKIPSQKCSTVTGVKNWFIAEPNRYIAKQLYQIDQKASSWSFQDFTDLSVIYEVSA